ncbi:MAG: GMC family oxidoreductase N-terminal domain-containing protein, partial [Sinobacterium sp.]|nr:GMC family oxidoreductase N-terminal domain-containing protein [Sinobacterium sp.]
ASVFTQATVDAAVSIGITHRDGMNDGDLGGVIGHNTMNYQGDRRTSSYAAYIHNQDLSNLTVVNHSVTHKVLFDGVQAVGIELEVNGGAIQKITANKEVILCAGALETPKLLMLSGIGPAEELKKFNIAPVLEQKYIGENLHDHPNVCMFYKGKKKLDFGYPQLYAFLRANKNLALKTARQPDTCLAFFAAPITLRQSMYRMAAAVALPQKMYEMPFMRKVFRVLIDAAFAIPVVTNTVDKLYGIVVILGKPESRGRLRLTSKNIHDQASIDCAYYKSEADMQTMLDGIAVAQKLAADAKLQAWGATPISAGGKTTDSKKLKKFVHAATMTTFHFCGSCQMGEGDDAPVDTQLKLKGIRGLRVVDASVIPEVPVSAINAPSMMIGHRAVDFILQDQQK